MPDKIRMNFPFFQAPNNIFDLNLTPQDLAVYFYLCRCGNHGGTAFLSYATIAQKCGMSKSTVIRTVKKLLERKLLTKTKE
jgi:predicted transcriptional regulator